MIFILVQHLLHHLVDYFQIYQADYQDLMQDLVIFLADLNYYYYYFDNNYSMMIMNLTLINVEMVHSDLEDYLIVQEMVHQDINGMEVVFVMQLLQPDDNINQRLMVVPLVDHPVMDMAMLLNTLDHRIIFEMLRSFQLQLIILNQLLFVVSILF